MMVDQNSPEDDLKEEFRLLGQNLVQAFHSAWDSPERKKLQHEIEGGLAELASAFRNESLNWKASSTGQQIKADLEDLGERLRTGEAIDQARSELLDILRKLNSELRKASDKWRDS